jgi:hypothetical protein
MLGGFIIWYYSDCLRTSTVWRVTRGLDYGWTAFQESFCVRDPARRHLGTQERGIVIASGRSMADWLSHAVGQQDAEVIPEHRVADG